jgi:hypothetical protein
MPKGSAPRALATCAALLGLLVASVASARPRWQAVGESSLGYTDNAQASATASEVRTGSFFWMLSPGVVFALDSPRRLQRIAYRYEYDFYFNSTASSSSTNRLDYRGFFELSRRANLVLGSGVTQSDRFNKVAFAAPGAGTVGALPAGTGSFLQGSLDQALTLDVAEGWRAWQTLNARGDTPIFDTRAPKTAGAGLRLGAERSFLADALGVEGRGDYTVVSGSVLTDGSPADVQKQLMVGGVALWRHDWIRELTSSAEAGVLRVKRLNTQRGFWTPIASATLSYATEDGDAQLVYAHTVTTNALLGQSLLVDEVRLRGDLPLTSKGELSLAGSCGYQYGRLLDENAELATRVRVALADVALGWQATKLLALGIRYQHIEQKSGADTPPLPVSFVQNNVLLGATLRFPAERDMPRPYRAPRRVDRTDELRDGFQPTATGPRAPGDGGR